MHNPPRNGLIYSTAKQIDLPGRPRGEPSLACRLFALRFGLTPATAVTVADIASYPPTAED